MRILVLDVGGTLTKSAMIGEDDQLVDYRETPSRSTSTIARLENAIDVACSYAGYDVVSFALTGQTDINRRAILFQYGMKAGVPQPEIPFGELASRRIHCPIFALNDSNAAALGEGRFGAGMGVTDFVCITYGTGVGSGIVLDGKLFQGKRGIAGEVGHLVTHVGGRLCGCGFRGCYERYASTSALVRAAARVNSELRSGLDVCAAMKTDPAVLAVVRAWVREIVEGLCSVAYLLNPERFVLGGGIMERGDIFDMVRQRFHKRIIPTFADVELVQAKLGNRAGLYGALAFARESIKTEKE